MKIVVLDAVTLGSEIDLTVLNEFGSVEIYDNTFANQVVERSQEAEIIITNKVKINQEMLRSLPGLKLICVAATGVDIIDLNACDESNVVVKNVKGYSTQSVTQQVFTMVLSLIGNPSYYDQFCKSNEWEDSKVFTNLSKPFWELSGKRWGIIGLGEIGKSVANVASAFGCEVVYFSVSGNVQDIDYIHLDLDELLKTSDIISLHCPLTDKTIGLLNKDRMNQIQDHAVLVNVARGAVINAKDLVEVKNEKSFKVALDVFDQEPLPHDHIMKKLKDRDDVLMSPHIAWASIEARKTLFNGVIKNIKEFI